MKFIKIESFQNDPLVKIISLNRPEVRNAFNPEMISELTELFIKENTENKSKLIILKAEGKVFCAGADLNWMKEMVKYSLAENIEDSNRLWNMFEAMRSCQVPVVTIAHGAVFAGALGLLSVSDYVFAEESTKFCFSEVKLGLVPAIISGFISRKIQDAFYRPLMLSAEIFKAQDAKNIGLVQKVYKNTDSSNIEVSEVVNHFSENGIEAMKETKKLLNSLLSGQDVAASKILCTRVISERRVGAEAQNRMKNFL